MQSHKEIDTRGLNCPLPILKAKKALADMASGSVLKIVSNDPGSMRDFQAYDPGRYAWTAAWSFVLGDSLVALRLGCVLFGCLGVLVFEPHRLPPEGSHLVQPSRRTCG